MKTIFLLLIFSFSVLYIEGQNNDSIIIKRNGKGIVEYVKFPSPQSPESKKVTIPETAKAFFEDYLKPAPATNFVLQPQKQRNENFRHEHYDQFYNGVKVDGAGDELHS